LGQVACNFLCKSYKAKQVGFAETEKPLGRGCCPYVKVFHGSLIKVLLHVRISTLNSEEVDSAALLLSPVVDLHKSL
jgi:hypothetical protein